jgi:hypothetical protein
VNYVPRVKQSTLLLKYYLFLYKIATDDFIMKIFVCECFTFTTQLYKYEEKILYIINIYIYIYIYKKFSTGFNIIMKLQ